MKTDSHADATYYPHLVDGCLCATMTNVRWIRSSFLSGDFLYLKDSPKDFYPYTSVHSSTFMSNVMRSD